MKLDDCPELHSRLHKCHGMASFSIRRQILDSEARETMKAALRVRSITGAFIYAARPYTTDIGEIKIFYDRQKRSMDRCRIKQLFTSEHRNRLSVRCDIVLIDKGETFSSQPFHHIYDFPQTGRYLTCLEPEILECSLNLSPDLLNDEQLNGMFLNTIKRHKELDDYIIRVHSYRDGKYYVDLLNSREESIIDYLKSQYKHKFIRNSMSASATSSEASFDTIDSQDESFQAFRPPAPSHLMSAYTIISRARANSHHRPKIYHGVVHYFRQKINEIAFNHSTQFLMLDRLLDVKLTIWEHPFDIYLIPRDPEYFKIHQGLLDDIGAYVKKHKLDLTNDKAYDAVYHVNERCLFRNSHVDQIGSWLRGVITEVPKVTKWCWVHLNRDECNKESCDPASPPIQENLKNFVYRVRSIDYGFENVVSVGNLRKTEDMSVFRRGSYSLRCRLFGIRPLSYNQDTEGKVDFSDTCKLMIDAWMREKLIQECRPSRFQVLFHKKLTQIAEDYQSAEGAMDITLFHHYEPVSKTIEDISYLPLKRKPKINYECLNTYLVENGYVTDEIDGIGSNVDLDHLLINKLANWDRT